MGLEDFTDNDTGDQITSQRLIGAAVQQSNQIDLSREAEAGLSRLIVASFVLTSGRMAGVLRSPHRETGLGGRIVESSGSAKYTSICRLRSQAAHQMEGFSTQLNGSQTLMVAILKPISLTRTILFEWFHPLCGSVVPWRKKECRLVDMEFRAALRHRM